jgi:hypothetical protein
MSRIDASPDTIPGQGKDGPRKCFDLAFAGSGEI